MDQTEHGPGRRPCCNQECVDVYIEALVDRGVVVDLSMVIVFVADVFGDEDFDYVDDGVVILVLCDVDEFCDFGSEGLSVFWDIFPDSDFGVACGEHVLAFDGEFLEEFFAWSHSGEFDFYIFVRFEAAECDQFCCEVYYFDGLSHIEDEDFSALSHSCGLEYELAGFGYSHEVSLHFWVGDSDGAALYDLFFEYWDDGAI